MAMHSHSSSLSGATDHLTSDREGGVTPISTLISLARNVEDQVLQSRALAASTADRLMGHQRMPGEVHAASPVRGSAGPIAVTPEVADLEDAIRSISRAANFVHSQIERLSSL